jgi:hypothetical protein
LRSAPGQPCGIILEIIEAEDVERSLELLRETIEETG